MTSTHSAADLRGISLANVARWDGGPSKTSQIVSFFPIENRLSIASRAARGLGTHAENAGFEPRPVANRRAALLKMVHASKLSRGGWPKLGGCGRARRSPFYPIGRLPGCCAA